MNVNYNNSVLLILDERGGDRIGGRESGQLNLLSEH